MKETGYKNILLTMDRFLGSLQSVQSPFEFATSLVKATAQQYDADIATLFRVTPSRTELIAEAGYDKSGEQLEAKAAYALPWEARREEDMPGGGLTAWVAVSGKPLFVKSSDELLDKKQHPAHKGAWDGALHPKTPAETFGCLYAVPLKVSGTEESVPRESVLGVYKIERRKDNRKGVFTERELLEFDLAARQISLVILLYERALVRVLSDARHAVSGRLADAIQQIDMVLTYFDPNLSALYGIPWDRKEMKLVDILDRVKSDANKVESWLRQSMYVYTNPTQNDRRELGNFVIDTIEARTNQQKEVYYHVPDEDWKININMPVAQTWDLHTLLLSLINNAIVHSGAPDKVSCVARVRRETNTNTVIFTVSDLGKGIPLKTIEDAKADTGPMFLGATKGTGLKRVLRVAEFRGWTVRHVPTALGTQFEVEVPITLGCQS